MVLFKAFVYFSYIGTCLVTSGHIETEWNNIENIHQNKCRVGVETSPGFVPRDRQAEGLLTSDCFESQEVSGSSQVRSS